jgi:CRP-like cAMP-binding protein
MKADGHTGRDIANYLGVSRATVYRVLAEQTDGRRLTRLADLAAQTDSNEH